MHFIQTIVAIFFAALFATSSVADTPAVAEKSMTAAGVPQWTITGVQRVCNKNDTQCHWTFQINPKIYSMTPVNFVTTSSGPVPASRNNGAAQNFGDYIITSSWSGQFGPGNGFTTLAVIDHKNRRIAWPSYSDKQVESCQMVVPDQSYPPQYLPSLSAQGNSINEYWCLHLRRERGVASNDGQSR